MFFYGLLLFSSNGSSEFFKKPHQSSDAFGGAFSENQYNKGMFNSVSWRSRLNSSLHWGCRGGF